MKFSKRIICIFFAFGMPFFCTTRVGAQGYQLPVVNPYPTNSVDMGAWESTGIDNGILIETLMPFQAGYRPVISIDGYNYTTASTIGLKIAWDNSNSEFRNATASSTGGFTPRIYLSGNNDGKVLIFLNVRGDIQLHFTVSTKLQGFSADEEGWFGRWTISDDSQRGTEVLYANSFSGDLQVGGLLTAASASLPVANIGELTVDHINGTLVLRGHPTDDGETVAVDGVTLYGDDGGIDIRSSNDNHSFIDFRGLAHLYTPPQAQGRILHSDDVGFKIYTAGDLNIPKMVINNNGVVGIGNTSGLASNTDVYKLYVEGGIRTRKVKVDQVRPWPDYVFEPAYNLRSLSSLEAYLKTNKHLPDVPSAADVAKDGNDVGETQAALLKKVEELTLYVIQLKKDLEGQNKEIQILKRGN